MRRMETLKHLDNPSVSGWQPGWEKMSGLTDTQMCALLPVQSLRGWDNSLIRELCQREGATAAKCFHPQLLHINTLHPVMHTVY